MTDTVSQREIYIIISQTGTLLSRILKRWTGAEYNHASVSLSPDLLTMYSFGRRHPYNPFWGGFVIESPNTGTFKRFSDTSVKVINVPVSEELYQKIAAYLKTMCLHQHDYHYNYLGLMLAALNICWRQKHCYYCSEFVRDLLLEFGVEGVEQLDAIIHPLHFLKLPNTNVIYEGKLREYNSTASRHD